MVRIDGEGEFDEEYFLTLAADIDAHSDWEIMENNEKTFDYAVEEAAKGRLGEIRFGNTETGTVLPAMIPNENFDAALTGKIREAVVQEPHPDFLPGDNSFQFQLGEAYNKIAEEHETDYLSPASSDEFNYDLLRLTVPWDYDESTLESALDAASNASQEAYQLNELTRVPVEEYLQE
jgi:hypothetical protein